MDTLSREDLEGLPWIEDSVEFGPVQYYRLVTGRRGRITIRVEQRLRKNGMWDETPYFYADTDCEIVLPGAPPSHPWASGRTAAEALRKMMLPNVSPDEIRRKQWD